MINVLVIVGPTAVGKSDLTVKLAKKFNGEIISADSRQVYKGLNIGAGKITRKEMMGIRHHLLSVADPKKQFSVIRFKNLAERAIGEILRRGKAPIVCGGSGFYIETLVNNVSLPDVPPDRKLRKNLRGKPAETLLKILTKLDPKRAEKIDAKNHRRIIRAIEIARALGHVPARAAASQFNTLFIGLALPPQELRKNIAARLIKRMRRGMAAEAGRLHKTGLSWQRMNELGLEYRYLALYLQGKMPKDKMIEKLKTEIWRYAKRQMTWFKRDKRICWFRPSDTKKIQRLVKNFLKKSSVKV